MKTSSITYDKLTKSVGLGPARAFSGRDDLGTDQDGAGCSGPVRKLPGLFRAGRRAVQSEICSARDGMGRPETNTIN